MNRDDIIRMARECGLTINDQPMLGIERFAALVAAAEREACARVCEAYDHADPLGVSLECASFIRARGE